MESTSTRAAGGFNPQTALRYAPWLMVACVGVAVWFGSRDAVLFQDDYVFVGEAQENRGLSWGWDWLSRPLFAHFSPIGRLEYGSLLMGTDVWLVARSVILLSLIGTTLGIVRLGRELGASLPTAAWAGVWFASSLVVWRLLQWWGAWVIVFVHLLFIVWMAAALARYLNSGRTRWAICALIATALACATYESAYLAPLWSILVVGLHALRDGARRIRRGKILGFLGAQALICLIFLATYMTRYSADLPKPTPRQFGEFLRDYVLAVMVPATVGLKQPNLAMGGQPAVLIVASVALVVVVFHYRTLWRELCLFGVVILGFAALFSYGRGGVGLWYVSDLQYYIDVAGLLAVGAAVLPSRREWPPGRPWIIPASLTALSILGAGLQGRHVLLMENPWAASRAWTSAVRELDGTDVGGYIAAGFAPESVTFPVWDRFAELSYVTSFHAGLDVGAGSGQPRVIDSRGAVRSPGGIEQEGGIGQCLTNGSIDLPVALVDDGAKVLVVGYSSDESAKAEVQHIVAGVPLQFDGNRRFGTFRPIPLPAGAPMSLARVISGPADQIRVTVSGGRVCLSDWQLHTAPPEL